MEDLVTLDEAARRLGVSRRRAQAMVTSSLLPAEKVGVQWLVPTEAIRSVAHTRLGRPGRPLGARGAWAAIAALETDPPRSYAELDDLRRRVRPRAAHLGFYVHPGVVDHARAHAAAVLGGRDAAAAAGAPVDRGDLDVYLRAGDLDEVMTRLRARPVIEDANVHVHVVPDDAWPFDAGQRFAGPWTAWLDLEDRQDRAAVTLLDRLVGGRFGA